MNEFLGNIPARTLVNHALNSGQVHHAYLFYGEDGLGKKTLAKQFAKGLLCSGEQPPCGVCTSCRKVQQSIHPDLTEVDDAKGPNSIHIKRVRGIRSDCVVKPNEGKWKIYLIPDIQDMTTGAFNAFLKTLEEPPLHTVFLLTARSLDILPDTVVSRVFPVELFPLDEKTVITELCRRFPNLENPVITEAAIASGGNLGQAQLRLTDTGLFELHQQARCFCNAADAGQEYEMLRILGGLEKDKEKLLLLLGEAVLLLRQKVRTGSSGGEDAAAARYLEMALFLETCREKLSVNVNVTLLSAYICAGMQRL